MARGRVVFSLARFAEIKARLQEEVEDPLAVLRAAGIDGATWERLERQWRDWLDRSSEDDAAGLPRLLWGDEPPPPPPPPREPAPPPRSGVRERPCIAPPPESPEPTACGPAATAADLAAAFDRDSPPKPPSHQPPFL